MNLQHMLLKIGKAILKFTFIPSTMSIVFVSFANQYLDICYYTANCLYLHVSCISKFEFVNFFFANLVVAFL